MKIRELFSPIPKEIFKNDDVRERVEIFLVLFVVAGLGFKFVKGSINDYQFLDDNNIALAVFVNAAVVAAFLLAYLLMCWVIRLALSFIFENFYHKNNRIPVVEAVERDGKITGYEDGGAWIMGIQFHPERLISSRDTTFLPIFKVLVREASR